MKDILLQILEEIWWIIKELVGLEYRRQSEERMVQNWHIHLTWFVVITGLTTLWWITVR
jgi:hypothetical protein